MRALDYRADIDGLRAVAVAAVVVFHAFPALLPGGFVGVDIFFVISGYLISSQILAGLERGDFRFTEFYARRARRLLPALFLVLASSAIAGWRLLLPQQLVILGRDIAAGLFFVPNFVFFADAGYFDAPSVTKPLLHLWSLGIEEQFYLVWPVALAAAFTSRRIALLAGVVLAGSFACNVILIATGHQDAAFYLPLSRFWELLAGAAIVHARTRSTLVPAAGAVLVALSVVVSTENNFPGLKALLPVAGAMMIIAGDGRALVNRVLSSRLPVALGLISYPLYLWHWPLLTFARIEALVPLTASQTLWILLLSVALAAATYHFAELPIRRWRPANRLNFKSATIMAAALLGFGLASSATEGFPQRLPQALSDIGNLSLDRDVWRNGRCFLNTGGGEFAPECSDREPAGAPRVMLWGDSYAAALYPGFRALAQRQGFRLDQFTASSCPPIHGLDDPANVLNCRRNNDRTFAGITQAPPDVVVIAGFWPMYDLSRLPATLAQIKQRSRVVLIGPVPNWGAAPIEARLLKAYKSDGVMPDRILPETQGALLLLDERLRKLADDVGVGYVAPLGILCDSRGCMTRTGNRINDLASFDEGHLNPSAAQWLVDRAFPNILEAPQP
jgi:peptidoglycan/LPS O-acetylase OafA/YrhL